MTEKKTNPKQRELLLKAVEELEGMFDLRRFSPNSPESRLAVREQVLLLRRNLLVVLRTLLEEWD